MTPEGPAAPDRARWPLRVALGVTLTILLVVGDGLYRVGHSTTTTVTPTTVVTPTSVGATTTTSPVTTTTRPRGPDAPIVNPGHLDQAARGCGLHVVAAASPSSAPTTTVRHVAGVGRCTVLEIGDSLGEDLAGGLAYEIIAPRDLRIFALDRSSTGLSASWFYNWPHHLSVALHRYHPNLVIVCLGANDEQALAAPGGSLAFGTPRWVTAYRQRIRTIATMATRAGSYLLWVGLPIVEPTVYRRGINLLNTEYRTVVAAVPGAAFQPTWRLLADARGGYRAGARVNGVESALRAADGIHFTSVGEDVLATFVARQIAAIYHVPLHLRAPAVING
ncbi:MAG: DUF459 domain-containing protein [Acidimicrobiales bacterium]